MQPRESVLLRTILAIDFPHVTSLLKPPKAIYDCPNRYLLDRQCQLTSWLTSSPPTLWVCYKERWMGLAHSEGRGRRTWWFPEEINKKGRVISDPACLDDFTSIHQEYSIPQYRFQICFWGANQFDIKRLYQCVQYRGGKESGKTRSQPNVLDSQIQKRQ